MKKAGLESIALKLEDIALRAIHEGLSILNILARETESPYWVTHSIPRNRLDNLAQALGYEDAGEVYDSVNEKRGSEWERWPWE